MQWREAVVAVAVVTLCAGCAPSSDVVSSTSDEGHVLLVQTRDTGAYPDALVEGTLTVVGTCFGLDTDHGTFVGVFPPGSSIVDGTEQVSIPHWGTLGMGDELSGGGGYYGADDLDYGDQLPEACREGEIAVVNPFG